MAKSKYTRARIRAAGRQGKRRGGGRWFAAAMSLIVVFGVVGIVLVRDGSDSSGVSPQPGNPTTGAPGDHWHTALAANICGEWISPPAEFENSAENINVRIGIHTHGDGFIHTHPFTSSEGGTNATFGRFLSYGGWSASEDSLSLWGGPAAAPGRTDFSNGDKCPPGTLYAGQAGVVKYSVNCKNQSGNPSDVRLTDGAVITLGFLPKSNPLGVPPNATATPADDGGDPKAINTAGCRTAGLGESEAATTTTLPVKP